MKQIRTAAVAAVAIALSLSACTANTSATPAGKSSGAADTKDAVITVDIKDDACAVSTATAPSGTVKFTLKNNGTVRNEFEILAEDKLRIVGERENLGPGTTTDYTIVLEPGIYYTACKKNMVGALVGVAKFTVTDSGKKIELSASEKELRDKAVANYTSYIKDQAGQLVEATNAFVAAYLAGDTAKAKSLYPTARMHYERIEPTAEAFGDLDPALDERESDWQEANDKASRPWTGWHAIEKDLWRPAGYKGLSKDEAKKMADKLVADTKKLYDQVYSADFKVSLDDISNGAIGLLEEVATSKITGEEETFSHTDLWDFAANVQGAEVAFGEVKELAAKKSPDLVKEIDKRFKDMAEALSQYKEGDGYKSYDKLNEEQRRDLSNKVNALRKPLAQLTEAVVK